jgi:large subunit ribosomal protein L24
MARQLKKNDMVVVITGAERGKRGRVLRVERAAGRIVVEGINVRKKAIKRSTDKPRGGIENTECPIHISNVMSEERYNARHPESAKAAEAAPAAPVAEAAPAES